MNVGILTVYSEKILPDHIEGKHFMIGQAAPNEIDDAPEQKGQTDSIHPFSQEDANGFIDLGRIEQQGTA